jgi:hypothetical protein
MFVMYAASTDELEHYDGHFYLAEGSAPLIVTLAG